MVQITNQNRRRKRRRRRRGGGGKRGREEEKNSKKKNLKGRVPIMNWGNNAHGKINPGTKPNVKILKPITHF